MNVTWAGVSHAFGGVQALSGVDLSVRSGETHGLMGENGAGKSTLGRVLAGILQPDAGTVRLDGSPVQLRCPADALAAGVAMVHQELSFCPELSVAENLCLGRWPRRAGRVDHRAMRARAGELLQRIGARLPLDAPLGSLSTAQEQLVQIAAAVGTGARVIVFDEPTSSLSEAEARHLFELIDELKRRGLTQVYISHHLHEVTRLCDRVTVLRDGRVTGTLQAGEADADRVVRLMIGRDLETGTPPHLEHEPGPVRLAVEGLHSGAGLHDVSLTVRAGEIVGLAGLVGSGRSELLRALFGVDAYDAGRVRVDGTALRARSVPAAMAAGLALVPEDRKRQGLVLGMTGRENWSLASLRRLRRGWRLDRAAEAAGAKQAFRQLDVRAPSVETSVQQLSGGNQQKVVLARWLARSAGVLLVDEPTRGVDVAAKAALHRRLSELAASGVAILAASSDLPELLHLCTRVLVLRQGRLVGERSRAEADEEGLLRLMAGVAA